MTVTDRHALQVSCPLSLWDIRNRNSIGVLGVGGERRQRWPDLQSPAFVCFWHKGICTEKCLFVVAPFRKVTLLLCILCNATNTYTCFFHWHTCVYFLDKLRHTFPCLEVPPWVHPSNVTPSIRLIFLFSTWAHSSSSTYRLPSWYVRQELWQNLLLRPRLWSLWCHHGLRVLVWLERCQVWSWHQRVWCHSGTRGMPGKERWVCQSQGRLQLSLSAGLCWRWQWDMSRYGSLTVKSFRHFWFAFVFCALPFK